MKTIRGQFGEAGQCCFVGWALPTLRRIGGLCPPYILIAILLLVPRAAIANPTQDEVFRSLTQNMEEQPDYGKIIPWIFAVAGLVAVVISMRQWQRRQAVPKVLNHQGKLIREVAKLAEIDAAEMKKLKNLAQELDCENPLTLLLCPSLMEKPEQAESDRNVKAG